MNINAYTAIRQARDNHTRVLDVVKIFSPAYYYAQTMIARCTEALAIPDQQLAWKHFIK